ncbi:hypothetical protein BACCELL_00211 [Bacteroides cellulosilyticus DSM 14838]|uniref:Uncharacterized protein n=1 Tax=Bacteroides cellulosilyticus DSM 14838 TaxID=537012 RepID=E2N7G8_9BACE|nr:hypothetical protein BACCELL_00211 [Bacteroides cellulosilyticus DSM 14838]
MRTLSTTHTTRHVEVKWRKGKSCFSRNTDEQGIPEEAEKTESSYYYLRYSNPKRQCKRSF